MINTSSIQGNLIKMDCKKIDSKNIVTQLCFDQCHGAKLDSKTDLLLLFMNFTFGFVPTVIGCLYEYSLVLVMTVIFLLLLYVIHKSYWKPELYVKELTEIGFDHIQSGPDRAMRIARAQSARRMGTRVPPPYPNGWFAVAESMELKIGAVLPVDALGQNLCVYRGEDGVARCVDAYCPHLGAHLAVGGSVSGTCIECPFHQWRFGQNGDLVSVPGLETAPKGISIKSWPTVEAEGAVWIWHDVEGREPLWTLADAQELDSWRYRGRNEFTVSCHVQEIPENGADVAHLNAVHSTSLLSRLGQKYPLLLNFIGCHHWNAEWTKNEDHTAAIRLSHDYKIMKMDLFHIDVNVTQIGPGHVRLHLNSAFGPLLISQSVTPLAPLQQRVVHRVFSPAYNAPIAFLILRAESYMFERDVAIWNHKRYVSAPAYVRADKSIRAFRSWFTQFYSPRSVSFKDAQQNTLDW